MKKIICDICTTNEGKDLCLYIGSQPGPMGSESVYEHIDICLDCLIIKLEKMSITNLIEFNKKILGIAR